MSDYVKDSVLVQSVSTDIPDFKCKINKVVASVTSDVMVGFGEALEYRFHVCHMTHRVVCKVFKKLGEILLSLYMCYLNIM